MNKAFTKEADDDGESRCPRCKSRGIAVLPETLSAHVPKRLLEDLSKSAYFCPEPHCPIAYFDMVERVVEADDLMQPVYPKDQEAPMCPCFGLTRDDVEADLEEGTPTRIRALLAKSKGPEARCAILSPSGQCCMPDVQRYYMKRRGGG